MWQEGQKRPWFQFLKPGKTKSADHYVQKGGILSTGKCQQSVQKSGIYSTEKCRHTVQKGGILSTEKYRHSVQKGGILNTEKCRHSVQKSAIYSTHKVPTLWERELFCLASAETRMFIRDGRHSVSK